MNRLGQVFEQLPGKPDEHLGGRGEARLPAGDEGEGLIERRVKGVPVQIAVDPSACANGKEITVSPTPRSARPKRERVTPPPRSGALKHRRSGSARGADAASGPYRPHCASGRMSSASASSWIETGRCTGLREK